LQIQASKEVDYDLLEKIEPFTLSKLTPYQKEFLSGFLAERYSVDVKEGWEDAKQEIKGELDSMVRTEVLSRGYDVVSSIRIAANYKKIAYKHILVPVWLSSYKYKKKTYQYMINGENGKVAGRAPVSAWKIIFLVLGIAAVGVAIYYLYQYFA
jgi:hypothetical protein